MYDQIAILTIGEYIVRGEFTFSAIIRVPIGNTVKNKIHTEEELAKMTEGAEFQDLKGRRLALLNNYLRRGFKLQSICPTQLSPGNRECEYYLLVPRQVEES